MFVSLSFPRLCLSAVPRRKFCTSSYRCLSGRRRETVPVCVEPHHQGQTSKQHVQGTIAANSLAFYLFSFKANRFTGNLLIQWLPPQTVLIILLILNRLTFLLYQNLFFQKLIIAMLFNYCLGCYFQFHANRMPCYNCICNKNFG